MKKKPKIYYGDQFVMTENERCYGEVLMPMPFSKCRGTKAIQEVETLRAQEQQK